MGVQWGIAEKHAAIGKKAVNNGIVTSPVVISDVDIIELSSNARV